MIKQALLVSLIFLSNSLVAQSISGSACVPDSGNKVVDEITAKALAKGQLSHEIGVRIHAKTQLKSTITENNGRAKTHDSITEQVTLVSQHQVNKVTTVQSGYQRFNGERFYCVEVQATP
ncbi:hypothetical protein G6Z92_06465 [Vibrio aestuarianus subsp. cardii]|uniref:hypothetical protein n=1 Tax=Vibrio aestuarianus TaxID=28171 RepID=UPI0015C555F4|nr:hypothetical protein [Vibrio aestuarianus]NGZ66629.1 hypothetical protein [Vibrio aestuarianus subsp. cardii]